MYYAKCTITIKHTFKFPEQQFKSILFSLLIATKKYVLDAVLPPSPGSWQTHAGVPIAAPPSSMTTGCSTLATGGINAILTVTFTNPYTFQCVKSDSGPFDVFCTSATTMTPAIGKFHFSHHSCITEKCIICNMN